MVGTGNMMTTKARILSVALGLVAVVAIALVCGSLSRADDRAASPGSGQLRGPGGSTARVEAADAPARPGPSFVDEDGNGICDRKAAGAAPARARARDGSGLGGQGWRRGRGACGRGEPGAGRGQGGCGRGAGGPCCGKEFIDEDKNGICDHKEKGDCPSTGDCARKRVRAGGADCPCKGEGPLGKGTLRGTGKGTR